MENKTDNTQGAHHIPIPTAAELQSHLAGIKTKLEELEGVNRMALGYIEELRAEAERLKRRKEELDAQERYIHERRALPPMKW